MATEPPVTVLDLGGTKIAAARVQDGRVLERRQIETPRDGAFASVLAAMAGLVGGWVDGPVGVAATGLVRSGRLTALNPRTLPIPPDQKLQDRLAAMLGVPVIVRNDAQAAAWGEFRHGAGRGGGSMVFLTISTGVGGGLILDGTLRTGPGGLAGHIGHVVAIPGGPVCGCGRLGCLEAVASGVALARAATQRFGRPMTVPELFAAADPDAAHLIDGAAAAIARALGDLRAALDLDLAVIGGGVGLAVGFVARVQAALLREPELFRITLAPATLGANAGLVGIAELVRNHSQGPRP